MVISDGFSFETLSLLLFAGELSTFSRTMTEHWPAVFVLQVSMLPLVSVAVTVAPRTGIPVAELNTVGVYVHWTVADLAKVEVPESLEKLSAAPLDNIAS